MRPICKKLHGGAALGLALCLSSMALAQESQRKPDLLVLAERLHPVASDPIDDAYVLIGGGKILALGPRSQLKAPEGLRTLRAAVVTPGLIDARSVVGLAGYLNQEQDSDQLERSAALQPELRALDAYDGRERLVRWVRELGITTIHTGHAPAMLVPGGTLIAKTHTGDVAQVAIDPLGMVVAVLGPSGYGPDGKAPGNRAKSVAMLRQALYAAQEYAAKRERAAEEGESAPPRELRHEAFAQVLSGERPLLVHAERARDLLTALRLREEFGFRMVLEGGSEAPLVLPALKAAGVPIILHPTMVRTRGERENASMSTAGKLAAAGIPFAFQSGYESYVPKTRVVLFEAAMAVRHGLSRAKALRALTFDAARILGQDKRIGSLAPGLDADLALFDGDPFETVTRCVATIIDGKSLERPAR